MELGGLRATDAGCGRESAALDLEWYSYERGVV